MANVSLDSAKPWTTTTAGAGAATPSGIYTFASRLMRLVEEVGVSPSARPSAEAGTEMRVLWMVKVPPNARLSNAKANTIMSVTCFMTKIPVACLTAGSFYERNLNLQTGAALGEAAITNLSATWRLVGPVGEDDVGAGAAEAGSESEKMCPRH